MTISTDQSVNFVCMRVGENEGGISRMLEVHIGPFMLKFRRVKELRLN